MTFLAMIAVPPQSVGQENGFMCQIFHFPLSYVVLSQVSIQQILCILLSVMNL